jgi:CHAT domain-containing protein
MLERHDCISVQSLKIVSEGRSDALIIEVDGSGSARNEARQRRPVPARWYVTLSADGTAVDGIEDEASRAARRLLEAQSDEQRMAALESATVSLPLLARLIADEAGDGDSAPARPAAEHLLGWSRTYGDPETESYALAALAQLEQRSGRHEEAIRYAGASRAAAERSASGEAAVHSDLIAGTVETDPARSLSLLRSAAAARKMSDDPRLSHRALYRQFRHHLKNVDMAACGVTLDALEASGLRYGDREATAWAHYGRTVLQATLGDYDRGYQSVVAVAEQARVMMINPLVEATALAMAGRIASGRAKSLELYARAQRTVPPNATALRAYILSVLSQRLLEGGRVDEASATVERALEAAESAEGRVHLSTALVAAVLVRLRQGLYAEAMQLAKRGIESDPNTLWVVWALKDLLGQTQLECSDYEGGIRTLRDAIDDIEARRALTTSNPLLRARHLDSRTSAYRSLIEALVHEHRFEEALITAERLKARSLEDSLAGVRPRMPLTEAESARERALEDVLVERNRDLLAVPRGQETEVRKRLDAARIELEAFNTKMAVLHASTDTAPPADILDLTAGTRTPIVEYAVGTHSVIAFVIRDGSIEARTLPASPEKIEADVRRLLQKLDRRALDYAKTARSLYDELVAPIADLLPRDGSVTIVPDTFLWQVPFNVLMTAKSRYLGDSYAIAYAPSLGILNNAARRGDGGVPYRTLLAVGDPTITGQRRVPSTYRDFSLGPLPDAAREVRALQQLYTPEQSTILTGTSAQESVFKEVASRYRIVHLATHGLVDDRSPLYSALLFGRSRGDREDGLLEMREIRKLKLNADLVVLSGCDTARGEIYSGEGVVGLSWAFLVAGCPQTVVSRWRVDSKATADLMITFHKRLRAGDSTAEALQKAQRELRKNPRYRQPFYWAPFVVVGSP